MKNVTLILCLLSSTFAVAVDICKPEEFVDGGPHPIVSISGFGYSPRCLRVPVGATITIQASGKHPLNGNAIREIHFLIPTPRPRLPRPKRQLNPANTFFTASTTEPAPAKEWPENY